MKETFLTIFLILIAVPIVFHSCEDAPMFSSDSKAPESKRMVLDSTSQYSDQSYKVYTLEGCEYVVSGWGNSRWGSHKGNCKNPIHQTPDTTENNYCNK